MATTFNTYTKPEKKEKKIEDLVEGFWEDDKGNKITEAIVGDTVYFRVQTKDIPTGEEIELYLFDWDGWLNPDDAIQNVSSAKKGDSYVKAAVDSSGSAKVSIIITNDFLPYINSDGGIEIELYFKCQYKKKKKKLPLKTDDYLMVYEKHETITVLVELPHSGYTDKLNRKGLGGHTGIFVGNEYYDFGPQPGQPFYSDGRPWWDDMIDPASVGGDDNVDKSEMLQVLNNDFPKAHEKSNVANLWNNYDQARYPYKNRWSFNIIGEVYLINIDIRESENKKLEKWWLDKYSNLGHYSIIPLLGEQCTTNVRISLEKCTKIFSFFDFSVFTQTPKGFVDLLINKAEHTAGVNKKKPLMVTQIYRELPVYEINSYEASL